MYIKTTEGLTAIKIPKETKISKKLPVFYNPVMKFNRDMTILLLNALGRRLRMADILAGTGVRAIRLLKETKAVEEVLINDHDPEAVKLIKQNLKLNNIKIGTKVTVRNQDANKLLLATCGFDYIDVDPFGSPNPFLDAAIIRSARNGILAVTATDTSALCGTYPNVCKRRYWATPIHNHLMYEVGIRILIRKVQLIGAQYERALIPIFSYIKDHYMRVFFEAKKGKLKADEIVAQHGKFKGAGPMWLGNLWDTALVRNMKKQSSPDHAKFLETIYRESRVHVVGYIDMNAKGKSQIPKIDDYMESLRKKGYLAERTHFLATGVRTTHHLK